MAGAFRVFAPATPKRVIILVIPALCLIPFIILADAFHIDGATDIHPETLSTLHAEAQRIGTWKVGVMLEKDGLAIGAFDIGGNHVAKRKIDFCAGMIGPSLREDIFVQTAGLAGEGTKRYKPVAPVDIDHHGDGPDAMCGIEVAVAVYGMLRTPMGFGKCFFAKLHTDAGRIFPIIELYTAQVMLIASLYVDDLTENILAYHIEDRHDIPPVTYVLQHHDMGLLLLSGMVNVAAVLCLNRSLILAPASVVAPFQYTMIVWAIVLGWVFFQESVSWSTMAGAFLIIAGCLIASRAKPKLAAEPIEAAAV